MNATATILTKNSIDHQESPENTSLHEFLNLWDADYKNKAKNIELFNTDVTAHYSSEQKEAFVKTFYHIRGHFHKFLWLLGNKAPNKKAKTQILYNIEEEFGADNLSHEELYFQFAKSLGFDVENEFVTEENHLPFIRDFNLKHLEWLNKNDWASQWAAFSAYERLDNIDYANLLSLAESIGTSRNGLTFFIVHSKADHFDRTYDSLKEVWKSNKEEVKEAFNFIGSHQLKMWSSLSEFISQI